MKVPGLWLEASLAMIQAAGYKDRPLLNAIERSIHLHKHYAYKTPKLIFAEPDNDLILLGAATIAIDKVLSNPGKYFPSN